MEVIEKSKNENSLVDQIESELNKGEREAFKSRLKELIKKRNEARKVVSALDVEISKAVSDFENGLA
ncbi:MAG: hypothetical protein AABY22_27650 [Nanoarchaeota archaeon]